MRELTLSYWEIQPGDLLRVGLPKPPITRYAGFYAPRWWQVDQTFYDSGHRVWLKDLSGEIRAQCELGNIAAPIRGSSEFEVIRPEGEPLDWLAAFLGVK